MTILSCVPLTLEELNLYLHMKFALIKTKRWRRCFSDGMLKSCSHFHRTKWYRHLHPEPHIFPQELSSSSISSPRVSASCCCRQNPPAATPWDPSCSDSTWASTPRSLIGCDYGGRRLPSCGAAASRAVVGLAAVFEPLLDRRVVAWRFWATAPLGSPVLQTMGTSRGILFAAFWPGCVAEFSCRLWLRIGMKLHQKINVARIIDEIMNKWCALIR